MRKPSTSERQCRKSTDRSGEEGDCQDGRLPFFCFLVASTVPCSTLMKRGDPAHQRGSAGGPRIDQVKRGVVRTVGCLFLVFGGEYRPLLDTDETKRSSTPERQCRKSTNRSGEEEDCQDGKLPFFFFFFFCCQHVPSPGGQGTEADRWRTHEQGPRRGCDPPPTPRRAKQKINQMQR